ncbi:MAG: hypothetical protein ACRD63_02215 [Pyrinomonadaceae bacterium]
MKIARWNMQFPNTLLQLSSLSITDAIIDFRKKSGLQFGLTLICSVCVNRVLTLISGVIAGYFNRVLSSLNSCTCLNSGTHKLQEDKNER